MSGAVGAPGSEEPKNHFCIGKDPVDSTVGVLQTDLHLQN